MLIDNMIRREEVEEFGINKRLEDLGRDLIAHDHYNRTIYIIQCKCWKHERLIRENVIAQLYGTTFAYQYDHLKRNLLYPYSIIPVIMFPSFASLSATAQEFCNKLKVKIWEVNYQEFPRIKCNINGDEKIYHLPFDQQYDRTQIKNKGEFYAYTVAEAEAKGFRRAFRHFNH